jgi:hypothetical protein
MEYRGNEQTYSDGLERAYAIRVARIFRFLDDESRLITDAMNRVKVDES